MVIYLQWLGFAILIQQSNIIVFLDTVITKYAYLAIEIHNENASSIVNG